MIILHFLYSSLFFSAELYVESIPLNNDSYSTTIMTKNKDIGYFWHLTDFHMDLEYPCNHTFGDYPCDSPFQLVKSALKLVKEQHSSPDFIVWTGDTGPHTKGLKMNQLKETMRNLTNLLEQTFAPDKIPLLPVMGNHDFIPANHMNVSNQNGDRIAWCHFLADIWSKWLVNPSPVMTPKPFSDSCFTSRLLKPHGDSIGLLLLSVNGMVWYADNPEANPKGKEFKDYDPLEELDWITKNLDFARVNNHRVIFASHFPLGAPEWDPTAWTHLYSWANKKLLTILQKYHDVISTILVAHEHTDTFRVVLDDALRPLATMFLAPSVTPFHMKNIGSFNPRVRLFSYSRSTGLILDYRQFLMDLSAPRPNWEIEYEARDAYFLDDLSAPQIKSLIDKFIDFDDYNNLWSGYWNREMGGRPHESKWANCPKAKSECRCIHTCAILHLDLDLLGRCLGSCLKQYRLGNLTGNEIPWWTAPENFWTEPIDQEGHFSSIPFIFGVIMVFLIILVGIVVIVNHQLCRNRGGSNAFTALTNNILQAMHSSDYIQRRNQNGEYHTDTNGILVDNDWHHAQSTGFMNAHLQNEYLIPRESSNHKKLVTGYDVTPSKYTELVKAPVIPSPSMGNRRSSISTVPGISVLTGSPLRSYPVIGAGEDQIRLVDASEEEDSDELNRSQIGYPTKSVSTKSQHTRSNSSTSQSDPAFVEPSISNQSNFADHESFGPNAPKRSRKSHRSRNKVNDLKTNEVTEHQIDESPLGQTNEEGSSNWQRRSTKFVQNIPDS